MKKKLCFGLKKSKIEPHEHFVSFNYEKIDIPNKCNLKHRVKQIYDQKNMNACSANATANLLSIVDKDNKLNCNISRMYLYFCTRWIDNNMILPVQDSGGTLKSTIDAISRYRYVDEDKVYPYFEHLVNDIPYKHVFEDAFKHKSPITSYRQIIPSKHAIKYILYKLEQSILFGMSIYTNFLDITKENDILGMPKTEDEFLGYHAVLIVGYDDETETFDILNSHGSDWGDDGYFRMKYEYILNPNLCFEFYCVQ